MNDREKVQELCEVNQHQWKEEYYGYRCENCNTFIPYGCEPWLPLDDFEGADEWDDDEDIMYN